MLSSLKERLEASLWVVPGLATLTAGLLAWALLALDRRREAGEGAWYLFGGEPESGREVLSTIASSMLSFTGLVFSITILVLQLASSQYSPRVLRTFLKDRVTKLSMGLFVGSFVFAMIVLPEVRDATDDRAAFVPSLSIFVAFLLVLASVLMFVRYIHQMAHSIRAVDIVNRVAEETRASIESLYPEDVGEEADEPRCEMPATEPRIVRNDMRGGIIGSVDENGLLRAAEHDRLCIALLHQIGDFVPRGAPLLQVWGDLDGSSADLQACIAIENERTVKQDAAFGFRQLVDIAERSLSTSLNDPTTAVQTLDQVHDLLRILVRRRFPSAARTDGRGRVLVYLPRPDWGAYVHLALDEVRQYGQGSLQVVRRLRAILRDLQSIAPPWRQPVLQEQLRLLDESSSKAFSTRGEFELSRDSNSKGQGGT